MAEEFGNFQTPLSPMRFQSQIGTESIRIHNEGSNIVRLFMARVKKVYYQYNTVDVVTIKYNNSTARNPIYEGRFSARLPVKFGGVTPEGDVYGTNTLVSVGSLVLIGFLDGDKDNPIVLSMYNEVDKQSKLARTTYSSADESDEALQRELWHLFSLYPSMTYDSIDGNGNREVTFSGKTFLYVSDTDPDNAYVQDKGFEYKDLPNARYSDKELIEPKSPDAPNILFVHQGIYSTKKVTFFIKPDGLLRVRSRDTKDDTSIEYEMNPDGSFSLLQQREDGNTSQVTINKSGNINVQSGENSLEVTKNEGVLINGKKLQDVIRDEALKVLKQS